MKNSRDSEDVQGTVVQVGGVLLQFTSIVLQYCCTGTGIRTPRLYYYWYVYATVVWVTCTLVTVQRNAVNNSKKGKLTAHMANIGNPLEKRRGFIGKVLMSSLLRLPETMVLVRHGACVANPAEIHV